MILMDRGVTSLEAVGTVKRGANFSAGRIFFIFARNINTSYEDDIKITYKKSTEHIKQSMFN